jgi:hypothetical protein
LSPAAAEATVGEQEQPDEADVEEDEAADPEDQGLGGVAHQVTPPMCRIRAVGATNASAQKNRSRIMRPP